MTNRRWIGGLITAVAGAEVLIANHDHAWDLILVAGSYLAGAGSTESDKHKAARLEWERQTGNEDRRS